MTFEQQTQVLRNIIQRTQLLLIAFGGAALLVLPFDTDVALMLATAGIMGGITCMGFSLLWCFPPGDNETAGPSDDDVTAHVLSECLRTGKPVFASREPGGRVRIFKAADGEDGEDGYGGEAGKDGKDGEDYCPPLFRKPDQLLIEYVCPRCAHTWSDVWSAAVDAECPMCKLSDIAPSSWEEVE